MQLPTGFDQDQYRRTAHWIVNEDEIARTADEMVRVHWSEGLSMDERIEKMGKAKKDESRYTTQGSKSTSRRSDKRSRGEKSHTTSSGSRRREGGDRFLEAYNNFLQASTVTHYNEAGEPVALTSLLPSGNPALVLALAKAGFQQGLPTAPSLQEAVVVAEREVEALRGNRGEAQRVLAESRSASRGLLKDSRDIRSDKSLDLFKPKTWFLYATTDDENMFNAVIQAELALRAKKWEVKRLKEWLVGCEKNPYSTLQEPLTYLDRDTGEPVANMPYVASLVRRPSRVSSQSRKDQQNIDKTVSAIWSSPPVSYSWYGAMKRSSEEDVGPSIRQTQKGGEDNDNEWGYIRTKQNKAMEMESQWR